MLGEREKVQTACTMMSRCMLVVVAAIGAAALQPCSRLRARLPPRPAAGNRRAETGEATRRQARVAQQLRSELAVLIRDGATRVKSTARVDPAVLRATSVVDVTVSPDLRAATATVTTRGDAAQKREAFSWLVANAKGFRYALAQRLRHSKRVPEVTFRKADVGGAVALMRLIDEANEGVDDDVIEGGLDFGLDLDEYDDED